MTRTLFSIIAAAAILSGMAAPAMASSPSFSAKCLAYGSPAWGTPDDSGTVNVPDTVTCISPYAFAGRDDIRRICFSPASRCTEIGEYAFLGCTSLTDLHLPTSLRLLGEGCMQECVSLRTVSVPEHVKAIPKECFRWCSALESVELPETLTDIGSRAFIYCSSLRSVKAKGAQEKEGICLPRRVEHIGSNAFGHCEAVERVVLPASVKELESYAFAECVSLREAWLPANGNLLGELMFSGCRSLTDLYEPSPAVPRFDCDSYIFEPDETEVYARCWLHVPASSRAAYVSAPGWRLFRIIDTLRSPSR